MKAEEIKKRLLDTYNDAVVEVFDMTGTSDHFHVDISSAAFKGLTRVNQHKAVMQVFDNELKTGELHALSLKTNPL